MTPSPISNAEMTVWIASNAGLIRKKSVFGVKVKWQLFKTKMSLIHVGSPGLGWSAANSESKYDYRTIAEADHENVQAQFTSIHTHHNRRFKQNHELGLLRQLIGVAEQVT